MSAHSKEMGREREGEERRVRQKEMIDKITVSGPCSTSHLSNINIMCTTYAILTFLVTTLSENKK